MKAKVSLFALIIVSAALTAHAEMQFSGFFITPHESLYSLTDTDDEQSSGWLKVGDSFRGLTVVSFDPKRESLAVKKGDRSLEIPLRASKVKNGKITINGIVSLAQGEKIDGIRASLFVGEEAVFVLKEGVALRITAEQRPDGNIRYRSSFEIQSKDGKKQIESNPAVIARPGQNFFIKNGDLGYAFQP